MAAALQQYPVALQGRSPSSAPISSAVRSLSLRSSSSSSSSFTAAATTLPFLRLSRGSARQAAVHRRHRGGGATMMDTAASRYATALADVAKSNGTLEATSADMEKVGKIFSDPSVYAFFANPTVENEKKQKLVDEIASSSRLQPHTSNFLNILLDMKRTDLVKDIVNEFELCYNKITGTELAVVTSVVPLESTHLTQIAKSVQRLTGANNVRIRTAIDPSLVAGFTVRYGSSGSKLIDMSVKKQLDEIASQLDFSKMVGSLVSS